jgi:hypothetical protein
MGLKGLIVEQGMLNVERGKGSGQWSVSVVSLSVSKYVSLFNNDPFFIAVEFERAKVFSGAFIRGNE